MLEKIKEVPFIDESSAVRLITENGKLVLERNDRVIWARETTALAVEDIDCYVEADKFFALFSNIKSLSQDTCLKVTLANGAYYELPFLTCKWETPAVPTEYEDSIFFKLDDLMLCTLKNLIKPELQCIYIDQEGAVSCDFISACVTSTVKSREAFLLPPEVQDLVNGTKCQVHFEGDKIFFKADNFEIITSKPTMSEDAWYDTLRQMVSDVSGFVKLGNLLEGLKRLAISNEYLSFEADRVVAGSNWEPFAFKAIQDRQYEIQRVLKISAFANEIAESNENLVLKNAECKFLISAMEEA